ncbi:unnamed protein product, partial [Mesorhabditis spiculigera]
MGLLLAPELERLVPTLPEACVVLVAYIAILVFPIVGRFHSLMRLYCLATLTPLFIMQLFQLIVPLVFPESRYFVLTTAINMYAGSQMLLCNSLLVKFVLERICDTSATYSDYRKMVILLSIIPAMPPSLLASQLSEETFVVVQIFNTILKVAAIIWECSMLIGLMRTVRGKHANMCDVSRADVYLLFTFCGCSTSITMLGYEASVGMDCAYEDTHDESTRILASDVAGLTCLGFPQWYFLVCRFKPATMALCFLFTFPCFILNLFRLHARPLERSIFLGEEVHETYGDRRKSVRTMVGADADLDMASQLAQMRNANGTQYYVTVHRVVNLAKMTATVHVSADSGIAEDVVEKGSLATTRRGSDESNIEKLELPNPVHYQAIQACRLRCAESTIAFPLSRDETTWPPNLLQLCDYGCRVQACETGCADLDGPVSTCATRCQLEAGSESCRQGCHAVEQNFVAQLQEVVDKARIHQMDDPATVPSDVTLAPETSAMRVSFGDEWNLVVQEVSALEVQWYIQSRSTEGNPGWKWTPLPQRSFRNISATCVVGIPRESSVENTARLAIGWRGRVVVSPATNWRLDPEKVIPKVQFSSGLQLSGDMYSVCWLSNRHQGQFRVALAKLDDQPLDEQNTDSTCHLLRKIPRENCCKVTIADVTDSPENPGLQTTHSFEMEEVPEFPGPSAGLLWTNGTHIERLADMDDFTLSRQPLLVPFDLALEDRISALVGISEELIVVGTEHGGIWIVPTPTPPALPIFEDTIVEAVTMENTTGTLMTSTTTTTIQTTVADQEGESDSHPTPPALPTSVKLREPDGSEITQIVHAELKLS